MFAIIIGIILITVGVFFVASSDLFRNRGTTSTIREELKGQRDSDRDAEQSIIGAKSTVESLSDGIREQDKRIRESVNGISETVERISEKEQEDRDIFEQIRSQKLSD